MSYKTTSKCTMPQMFLSDFEALKKMFLEEISIEFIYWQSAASVNIYTTSVYFQVRADFT